LSKPDAAKHVIESSVAAFDQINLLVLNAGIFPTSLVADDNVVEDYVRTYQVNLFSSVSATKYAIPYLRKSKGTIIYISSLAAQQAIGGFSAYGSSKAALNHFVASVGNEEKDITSISIGPGSVETDKAMETLDHDSGKLDKNLAQALRTMREEGKLVQPDNVGKIIAQFSLVAPHEWSGRFILDINTDEEVHKLISV
jgi:NAD(P)-dependent dehydrogenase (short-subunit alcohol dehydrogenase family)